MFVDVQAVADIHHAGAEPDTAGVTHKSVAIQHVVAVDPRGEKPGAELQSAIDRGALPAIRAH